MYLKMSSIGHVNELVVTDMSQDNHRLRHEELEIKVQRTKATKRAATSMRGKPVLFKAKAPKLTEPPPPEMASICACFEVFRKQRDAPKHPECSRYEWKVYKNAKDMIFEGVWDKNDQRRMKLEMMQTKWAMEKFYTSWKDGKGTDQAEKKKCDCGHVPVCSPLCYRRQAEKVFCDCGHWPLCGPRCNLFQMRWLVRERVFPAVS